MTVESDAVKRKQSEMTAAEEGGSSGGEENGEEVSAAAAAAGEKGASSSTKQDHHEKGKAHKKVKREHRVDTRGTRERVESENGDQGPRLPKRKVSVAFGYCGIGYSGLQINPDVKTIEGDIFEAFCQLGAISKDNAVNPNKVGLQRAARTDRGVHAAGNLLALKLILEPPGIEPGQLRNKMNEILPEFIRIWDFTKVENSFNARTNCDSRQYEYLIPSYVFLPPKPGTHMYTMMQKWKDDTKDGDGDASTLQQQQQQTGEQSSSSSASSEEKKKTTDNDEYRPTLEYLLDHPFWRAQSPDQSFAQDTAAKKQWRISSTQLDRIRDIFSKYEGSHNFHNYTIGKAFRDRSAHRNMIKLTISEPKIINETEWLSLKFHGQSFMLHQIRKMIGLLVLVGRSTAPASLLPETYGPARIHVPKAPGLGLLLEEPIFAGYNRRVQQNLQRQTEGNKASGKGDGGVVKEEIVFNRYATEKDAFKNKWIYDRIYKEEEEKHEYVKFLQYLDVLSGDDFEYLNPRGVIPTSAIIKVGEQVRHLHRKDEAGDTKDEDKAAYEGMNAESDDEEGILNANDAELEG